MAVEDLIHARFVARARLQPDALAISSDDGEISYGALDEVSAALAAQVTQAAPGQRDVVAILADRGPRLIAAMLACARAGRPFVVFDLSYPDARLRTLAQTCRPALLLLAGEGAARRLTHLGLPAIEVRLKAAPSGSPALLPTGAPADPDAPAYLLFTSGSTGQPKCVSCSHRPLVNFVRWQAETFGLGGEDRFTLLSGLSHDPILRDVFTPLSLGGSIHIPAQETLTAPGGLYSWFSRVRPTVAHMTPPLGSLLTTVRSPSGDLNTLRYVFWGGDVLRAALVDAVAALAPKVQSVNFYGSTETPQAASFCRATPGGEARVPIGRGIDGFEVEICDEAGRPVADGQPGEIVIRSRFLTMGYVEDGRLPGPGEASDRYRTGDIGVRRPDGMVAIQGRRDDQVKVRGYRVEMAEITATALAVGEVAQAVTLDVGSSGQVRLCCFVQPADAAAGVNTTELRADMAARLPAYMVPDTVVALDQLPLLPNGKIDRQTLIARERHRLEEAARPVAGLSPTEAALVKHWRGFLGASVGPHSSFASAGGDSLSYVNAYLAVEEVLGRVPDHWTTLTIAELAAMAAQAGPAPRPGLFAKVESAILLRALAIGMVVASHFQLLFTGGGATSALIWVSGFLFGSLQLREVDHQTSLKPIWRVLKSILIPLAVYEAPQLLVKALTHYHFKLSSLLLYVDLVDYTGQPASGPEAYGGAEFYLWYIHCLIHIVLLYAVLIALFRYVVKVRRPAMAALAGAVGLGLFGRFLMPVLFAPDFWSGPVQPMSFFNHSPTTHLATFALAALSGFVRGRWRMATVALGVAYAALSVPLFGAIDAAAIGAVAALLVLAPKMSLPRVLSRPVYMVAGASFFIYLLHFKFWAVGTKLHLPALAIWPLAMVGGVVAWSVWTWAVDRLRRAPAWLAERRGPAWWMGSAKPASA